MKQGRKRIYFEPNLCIDCGTEISRNAQLCHKCAAIQANVQKAPPNSIEEARRRNPCATLQQIANKHGVSRERVRQRLNDAQLPTRHLIQKFLCLYCNAEFTPLCKGQRFCSATCKHIYHNPLVECHVCGTMFRIRLSYLKRKIKQGKADKLFCSKTCYGHYCGKTYGKGMPRKYDHSKVIALRKEGLPFSQIAKTLNMSPARAFSICKEEREKVLSQ